MTRLLARAEAHARATAVLAAESREVGAFTLLVDAGEAYAVVREPPADPAADVAALRGAFAELGLPVRLELAQLLWLDLVPQLLENGLEPDEDAPLFVAVPDRLSPSPPGPVAVRWVDPGENLAFIGSVMRQGLEIRGGPPTEDELAGLRAGLQGPVRLALAQLAAAPAGTGSSTPVAGVTEIAAVSTIPTVRRRGVASALVSFLCRQHFAAGGELAWACTGDPAAAAMFYKLGFEDGGVRVSFRDGAASSG
jgi:GNAT superfamily N-acetyltransferase